MSAPSPPGQPPAGPLPEPPRRPGDGIRSLETSGVFRTLNFELYARPNKYFMTFGIIAITGSSLYLYYMRQQHKEQGLYTALDDNDEMYLTKKRSKWD